ncbi:TetR/AcrR family transcriptional regulator [Synechococcus sp. PCC 7336]|uniref:TetR/AcrR family transcriptional regulator n=1 Tax=Synechococcus sp. PCC 7336 TaxID=195250 RepID=UPI00034D1DF6|nr:TetR/AcrR family transcriptional regulator [Synechococcus sp. PCC 7336]
MSKQQAIAQLVPVFRRYGYEGATLSRLSQASGLGRASLYHYFPEGKEEMAAAVLQYVNRWFAETVLAPLKGDGEPGDRLRAMSEGLAEFYRHGEETCLLSAMSLGEADDLFHAQLQEAMAAWMGAIAKVLQEAGLSPELARQRAEGSVMQIQGALVVARVMGDMTAFERAIQRLPVMLLERDWDGFTES